jgi:hypothetical protein
MSLVRDLKREKEYAAKAETKMGKMVAGITTMSELNIALLREIPADWSDQALM